MVNQGPHQRKMQRYLASFPGPILSFSMLHAEKREGLVSKITCVTFSGTWYMVHGTW